MSGLRAPLSSFRFYGPGGEDVTEAVLAAAAAAAGGGSGGGGAATDGGASSGGAGVVAETSVFHASGGGAARMAADMQVRSNIWRCHQAAWVQQLGSGMQHSHRWGIWAAELIGTCPSLQLLLHCVHLAITSLRPPCAGAVPGQRAAGPRPEPGGRGGPLCV